MAGATDGPISAEGSRGVCWTGQFGRSTTTGRSSGERLASLAGWSPGGQADVLLGAQLAAPLRALVTALVGAPAEPDAG